MFSLLFFFILSTCISWHHTACTPRHFDATFLSSIFSKPLSAPAPPGAINPQLRLRQNLQAPTLPPRRRLRVCASQTQESQRTRPHHHQNCMFSRYHVLHEKESSRCAASGEVGRGEYGSDRLVGEREVGWGEVNLGSEGEDWRGEEWGDVDSVGQSVYGAEGWVECESIEFLQSLRLCCG